MSTRTDQAKELYKVIVVAKITGLPRDTQTYFWSNGRWQTNEGLATKMRLREADELVASFLAKPVLPMSPASKYNMRKVADRPSRKAA